jgi:glutathione S-transferase
MKLYWTPASPFVRKVMVTSFELGLMDRIEIVPTFWPHSWGTKTIAFDPPDLVVSNPVGRIPALVTDGGAAIMASRAPSPTAHNRSKGRNSSASGGKTRRDAARSAGTFGGLHPQTGGPHLALLRQL